MRRITAWILILFIFVSPACLVASAGGGESAVLFETDFNGETGAAGTAPTTVKNPDTGAAFGGTSRAVLCAAEANDRDSKHLSLITRVGAFSSDTISGGQFIIEFDAMVNKGFLSVGLIDTSSATGKWLFGLSRESSDRLYTWTNSGGVPPTSPTHIFADKATGQDLTFQKNVWHSYRLKVDVDHSSVTVFIDGKESKTITGYVYFGGANPDIKGVVFRNDFKPSEAADVYIDNIKLQWAETEVSDVRLRTYDGTYNSGFSAVSTRTERLEIRMTNPVQRESFCGAASLYNNTREEYEAFARLEMESGDKLLCAYFEKPLFANSGYTLRIASDAKDIYGRNLEEYTLDFTTGEDEAGFDIIETVILKNGARAALSDLSAGDTITLMAKYAQVGQRTEPPELIFAYCAEKNLGLRDFDAFRVECGETGLVTVTRDVVIKAEAEFDALYFYLWDAKSLAPAAQGVRLN